MAGSYSKLKIQKRRISQWQNGCITDSCNGCSGMAFSNNVD